MHVVRSRIKISVFTDISVFGFYGYIGYIRDISVFINYSKFKYTFNLYIKISLKVYEMKTFHFLSYRLGFPPFFIIINDRRHKNSNRLLFFFSFLQIINDIRHKNSSLDLLPFSTNN